MKILSTEKKVVCKGEKERMQQRGGKEEFHRFYFGEKAKKKSFMPIKGKIMSELNLPKNR